VSFDVSCTFTPESRIVFQRHRISDSEPTIWTIRPDGTDLQQLTTEFGTFPAWSKDGTRIVFWGIRGLVAIMNWDGSEKAVLSHDFASRSTWSPDGTQVAYGSCCGLQADIWISNLDRTGAMRLTDDAAEDLGMSWSPDGGMIVFEKEGQIEIVDTNGSPVASLGPGAWPRWSPDGSLIIFPWAAPGGTPQIWTMNVDGSNRTQLTDIAPDCGAPSYRPDGAEIVFHCPRVGNEFIWRMNADGSNPRVFAEIPGPGSAHPDWFTP